MTRFRGSDGAELWRATLNAGFFGSDQANDVGVDPNGDIIAGGFVTRSNIQRFAMVKLDGDTGQVV